MSSIHPTRAGARRVPPGPPSAPDSAVAPGPPSPPVAPSPPVVSDPPGVSDPLLARRPQVPGWDVIVSVVAGLDGAGVVLWLLDGRGRVSGALVGPADWPLDDRVVALLVESAVDGDAAGIVAVRLRAGPAEPDADDRAGFATLVAACARAEIPVLACLLAVSGRVVEVRP